jgi:hypothetical protein
MAPGIHDVRREATPGPGGARRAFVEGLTRPSPVAIGLALAFNLLIFAALAIVLTPEFIAARPAGLLAEHPADYDAFVTSRVIAVGLQPVEQPVLLILGGSTIRSALLESDLAEGLRDGDLHGIRVIKLCTSRQTLWESLALAEHLPAGARGVVLVGVSPTLLAMGEEELSELARHPRLGIRSQLLDAELHRRGLPVGPRSGIHLLDNAAFLLPRLGNLLRHARTGSPQEELDSRYVGTRPAPAAVASAVAERVNRRFDDLPANRPSNVVLLDQIVGTIRARTQLQIVLVESPLNPEFVQVNRRQDVVAEHRTQMAEFARARGLTYVLLDDAAALSPADFHDWAHLADRAALRRSADAVLRSIRAYLAPDPGSSS